MSRVLAAHGAVARGAFAVVVLLSFTILFAPGSDVPPSPPGADKLVHGGLFLALAVSGRWAGIRQGALIQAVPALHRDATVGDWLADVVGALAGLLLWTLLTRRLHR